MTQDLATFLLMLMLALGVAYCLIVAFGGWIDKQMGGKDRDSFLGD